MGSSTVAPHAAAGWALQAESTSRRSLQQAATLAWGEIRNARPLASPHTRRVRDNAERVLRAQVPMARETDCLLVHFSSFYAQSIVTAPQRRGSVTLAMVGGIGPREPSLPVVGPVSKGTPPSRTLREWWIVAQCKLPEGQQRAFRHIRQYDRQGLMGTVAVGLLVDGVVGLKPASEIEVQAAADQKLAIAFRPSSGCALRRSGSRSYFDSRVQQGAGVGEPVCQFAPG